jgi:methionyl-tRNA formyltransferase
MRIMVVTQEDPAYIPQFVAALMPTRGENIVGITVLRGEIAASNIWKYLALLGPVDFVRHAVRYALARVRNVRFPRGKDGTYYSVRAVARHFGKPIFEPRNVNESHYVEELRELGVDLIVSIAAPQIFKRKLLDLPRYGCINVHNGLLPKYQGLMPSFWVLANGEKWTGTTVHYMNEAVDRGPVIVREEIPIAEGETMHSLMYRTKTLMGPRLLLRAISVLEAGDVQTMETDWSTGTYFGFPDREAVRRFRAAGRKFG